MSRAGGRYHASGYPSLSSVVCAPCRCTTSGTGPRYGPGVLVNSGRMSRPETPPGRPGMVGGTNSGVTYFGTVRGSSVPPGTGSAYAGLRARYAVGTSSAAPPTVPAASTWRRVGMVHSPGVDLRGVIQTAGRFTAQ